MCSANATIGQTRRNPRDIFLVVFGLVLIAVAIGAPAVIVASTGLKATSPVVVGWVCAGYSIAAVYAALATAQMAKSQPGIEAGTWRYLSIGLAVWASGGMAYIASLALGGDPLHPSVWSQIGYLCAYPFWYRALLRMRQPILATSRRRQLEVASIEITTLLIVAVLIGSLMWHPGLGTSENIAQLVPAAFDLLLLAAFYGAVRRSRLSSNTAMGWLGAAFGLLALSDVLATLVVGRGALAIAAFPMTGYIVAMLLVVMAASRPLRLTEAQNRVRGTAGMMAIVGLALAGGAFIVAPASLRPAVAIAATILVWRLFVILNDRDKSDIDELTGFLDARAFERFLGGVVQLSSVERPALLLVVDVEGFGGWNARNGYAHGDALLERVAKALEQSGSAAMAWGRLKADRFALTTVSQGARADREAADRLRLIAESATDGLRVRAASVQLPVDAKSAVEALDAADEALRVASQYQRSVVCYAAGRLDGLLSTPGSASLVVRRARIQQVLAQDGFVTAVLQPIVRLEDLTVCGFEGLSRFNVDPRRGPDEWIAEATNVGLGIDLEIVCAQRVWERKAEVPDGCHLAVNVSPDAIMSDQFTVAFGDRDFSGLVIEITEHERVKNYPRLAARLAGLREQGASIAIDDTGAGHASLNHLIELKPDYIKLDRNLVSGLDTDHGKLVLVRNMLHLAEDLGAKLVAEGIETKGELLALRALSVPFGQGYFLARPDNDARAALDLSAAGLSAGVAPTSNKAAGVVSSAQHAPQGAR